MNPEIALLDQLSLAPLPYFVAEGHMFGGDRDFALGTILALVREGKVTLAQSGSEIPAATIQRLASHPDETATIAALGATTIDITAAGLDYFLEQ